MENNGLDGLIFITKIAQVPVNIKEFRTLNIKIMILNMAFLQFAYARTK